MDHCKFCKNLFKKKYPRQIYCSIICSNRFNLNNKNAFIAPKKYSAELAEIFGIFLGDGSVTKYFAKICLNRVADKGYSKNIFRMINKVFPTTRVTIQDQPQYGLELLQISSRDFCEYMKSIGFDPKTRTLPEWIQSNMDFKKSAIRGLFDTEGSIGIKRIQTKKGISTYKQLTVTNLNPNILKFLETGLEELGFSPTKNSRKNIYLSNRSDIARYFKVIGTSNPKLEKKARF